jgi:vacuolar-type H+-ATPase subunit E/Vma4
VNGTLSPPKDGAAADPVVSLCERVGRFARQSGEELLQARRRDAERMVAGARKQAEAECEAALTRASQRLDRQARRDLQNARLDTRAALARCCWALLDELLDEAMRQAVRLREADPARYASALRRLLAAARHGLAGTRLVVQANSCDLPLLREALEQGGPGLRDAVQELVPAEVEAGLVVVTPDGTALVDQSLARRRERLDSELRLAAAEVVFAGEEGHPV